jgi:hypothetical protein
MMAQQAGKGVAGIAGRLGNDDANRPGGVFLRQRSACHASACDEQRHNPNDVFHGLLPDGRGKLRT